MSQELNAESVRIDGEDGAGPCHRSMPGGVRSLNYLLNSERLADSVRSSPLLSSTQLNEEKGARKIDEI
jgi:hypothetical protein